MTEQVADEAGNVQVVRVEDMEPLSYARLMDRTLYKFLHGVWNYSDDRIGEVFINKFGKGFDLSTINPDNDEHKAIILEIAQEILADRLMKIKKEGTSLVADNVNQATEDMLDIADVNLDISQAPTSLCKDIFARRVGHIPELRDTYEILWNGHRLFDLYSAGVVSPDINEDVLKMQDMYRNGVINREILASYYYNVAMVYEKYSMQKNNAQAVYKEHYRAVEFMKKSLSKVEQNVSLVMTLKDYLANEPNYDPQTVLDACHRIMDTNHDDHSLYLAHKLYADTLKESKDINGFSNDRRSEKISEHYRIALGYTTAKEDKLDILEAIAESQKFNDNKGYVATQLEIADLLSGRKRIRALKNVAYKVQNPKQKAILLKSAVNEFADLSEFRSEDIAMFKSLDRNLRLVAADEPETIKILDGLRKKHKIKDIKKQSNVFAQMSSRGTDLFTK